MLNNEIKKRILTTAISTSIMMSLLFNNSKEMVYASDNPSNDIRTESELSNNNEITEIEKNNEYEVFIEEFTSIHQEMLDNNPEIRIRRMAEKYGLTIDELKVVIGVILAEARDYSVNDLESQEHSYNDAYNVTNCMYNRMCNKRWVASSGSTLYNIATARSQFSVYSSGKYKKLTNVVEGPDFDAILDFLETEEVKHNYLSFNYSGSKAGVALVPGGNEFYQEFPEHERIPREEVFERILTK